MRLGTGKKSFDFALVPCVAAMLDAHKIDCIATIDVEGPAGVQPVAIERIWLIVDFDPTKNLIFGYSVGIRTEVGVADVERAFLFSSRGWQRRAIRIPGIEYHRDAGFPCSVFEGFLERRPAMVKLDNAAAHQATRIIEDFRRATGAAITWGAVKQWSFNAGLERLFKTLENNVFQLLTSSVGSGPQDPHRPKDSVGNAIRYHVSLSDIIDLTDVALANFNATPSSALGNRSPLQALSDSLSRGEVLPRMGLPHSAFTPRMGYTKRIVTVRGKLRKGRRPYVQFKRERYSGSGLADRFDLIGQKLVIHIPNDDLRTVEAYEMTGAPLGTLKALGRWRRSKHSLEMRDAVNALYKSGEVHCASDGDMVESFHSYLRAKSAVQMIKQPNKINPQATKLANASFQTGLPTVVQVAQAPTPIDPREPSLPVIDVDWSVL